MLENNWLALFFVFFLGGLMSLGYLGLLWLSVKKVTQSSSTYFFVLVGFFIRLAGIGVTLFFIAKWVQFPGILFYLLGFFIVKKIMQRKIHGYHH